MEDSASQLRRDVEMRLAQVECDAAATPPNAAMLHELQALRLELKMQHDSLRRAQIALEESRERYVDFHDFAPVGYLTLNDNGQIAEINLAGAEMLGMDRKELLQRRFIHSVAAGAVDLWQKHFTEALREDAKQNCELALSRPDGTRIDVRLDSLRRTKEGKGTELRVVLTDITERKQTNEALNASEQRFRDIVNTTDGIVWEADATTFTFTFISQQAERLLGYPADDWLKPGFWVENLHPDDKVWAPEYCASYTKRVEPHDFEYRFIAKDGRTVWLHDIVTVVAEDGAARWLRGIMVDVTQRKLAEEQLREMAVNLEAMVQERTKQLRRLSAQLTMTEERERRLLARDLHDNLGQLLAVIKIKLTSLIAGPLQGPINQVVDLVDRAEHSARSITLELSPPILHTLGLVPALEWLADEVERVYGVVVHIDTDICRNQQGDEIQAMLYRSVRELLSNVAKHADVNDASVTCLCEEGRLMIVVSDDGCGFDPADHGGVYSGQHSFGLSSIYERIVNIGGSMEVDSCPGHGTTITLAVACSSAKKEACNDPHCSCR